MAETGAGLLQVYKEQYGIEKNFSFPKEPLIVNDIFLKKPERIEVLGAVLLISLMIWNLIEHTLRQHIKECEVTLPGWDKKQTNQTSNCIYDEHKIHGLSGGKNGWFVPISCITY